MQEIQRAKRGSKPRLIVLCGPSHTGKTTFACRLGSSFTIVSSDGIRKQLAVGFGHSSEEARVWRIFESMKRRALKKGLDVVLDACHISKRARRHSLQGPNAHHRRICVVFGLPLRTVRERWLEDRRISLREAERMWKDFQSSKPTVKELRREGFDEVYFVKEWLPGTQGRGISRIARQLGE